MTSIAEGMTPSASSATVTGNHEPETSAASSHSMLYDETGYAGESAAAAAAAAAAMPPPRFTNRTMASGQSGYASIADGENSRERADVTLQPTGKAPVAGQSHAHRPVSAMPTPSSSSRGQEQNLNPGILATINNSTYADRRQSAQPTLPSMVQTPGAMAPPMSFSPSNMDTLASTAITQGVPITSPAALQYFAAHPRRQQVHFGSYLLLQTLGEGEFGKVKLGVHKEWGEEVAVKLIKRDKVGTPDGQLQLSGPAKDPAKMSKVEKEIRVLKDVRHPNIVRLYEVIESDRYIGIVLEYASGGELFDHILAHKYLKERDACRLFAQLISGVNYLHQKKIIHRDLKLENLLLDRNRNVIITDFGFANNFENKRDDLMATSCGSPCYAAPELVVQDGLYAGSAVDVWSCGVILYAMLAGYLPFDDDPANPDGDNINLLYKYIMATPLSFPDYIPADPRDLLCKMLVPDPANRATLMDVMAHSWLFPYRDLFKFTVDELERAAIEQQNKKRQIYRQQMLLQQRMQEQQRSGRGFLDEDADQATTTKQQRHRSALATSTTVPNRMHEPLTASSTSREMPVSDINEFAPAAGAFPSSATHGAIASQRTSNENEASSPVPKKNAGAKTQRHTVQLEYNAGPTQASATRRRPSPSREVSSNSTASKNARTDNGPSEKPSASSTGANVPMLTTGVHDPVVQAGTSLVEAMPASAGDAGATQGQEKSPSPARSPPSKSPRPSATSETSKSGFSANETRPVDRRVSALTTDQDRTSDAPQSAPAAAQRIPSSGSTRSAKSGRGVDARRSGMAADSTNGSKLLTPPRNAETNDVIDDLEAQTPVVNGRKADKRRKAMSLIVGKAQDPSEKEREKTSKVERRLTARLRKDTLKDAQQPSTPSRNVSSARTGPSPSSLAASSSFLRSPRSTGKQQATASNVNPSANDSSSTVGPSSSAAKKVMDWFRKRSLNRTATEERPPLGPFELNKANAPPATPAKAKEAQDAQSPKAETPQVVVTGERGAEDVANAQTVESVPSSRSTSGTHSQVSQASESTGLTAATDGAAAPRSTSGQKSSTATVQQTPSQQATPRASAATVHKPSQSNASFQDNVLHVHQGAVDQSALTSRKPTDVFERVQRALWEMGIEVRKEQGDDFKLECYRRKRAKTLMGATQGLGQSLRASVFPPSQADYERSVSNAGSRSPGNATSTSMSTSPSTAGSIRSFLRRSSNQPGVGSSGGSDDGTSALPTPMYGEPAVDGGQEVRFSVEVTRIRNLPGLYSVDIRRMKGNLWAYKWVYHTLLDRCQLSGTSPALPATPTRA